MKANKFILSGIVEAILWITAWVFLSVKLHPDELFTTGALALAGLAGAIFGIFLIVSKLKYLQISTNQPLAWEEKRSMMWGTTLLVVILVLSHIIFYRNDITRDLAFPLITLAAFRLGYLRIMTMILRKRAKIKE